jgi:hypothetical protein
VAATCDLSPGRRALNGLVRGLLRPGRGPRRTDLLTVAGRRTGRPRWTPVTRGETDQGRWRVAPDGPVGSVRNARAAGRATLSRGRRRETVALTEVGPAESAPVLRRHVAEVPVPRAFFDAGPEAPLEAFLAEATRHAVFRITSTTAASDAARSTPGRSA